MLALLLPVGCGSCNDFTDVPLASLSPATREADRSQFEENFVANWGLDTTLDKLAQHPATARVFVALGYMRYDGKMLKMTKTGFAISSNHYYKDEAFFDLGHSEASPFLSARDGHECDEGDTHVRIYRFQARVTRLTTLGERLFSAGQLVRLSDTGNRRPWHGLHDTLAGTATVYLSPGSEKNFIVGGDDVVVSWDHE